MTKPSTLIYCGWINQNRLSILQSADEQGNPSSCAGHTTQIPMHSHSIGCPKIFPPSAPLLYWLSHLTRILNLKAKKKKKNGWKTFILTQNKVRNKQHFFAIFRQILIMWNLSYLVTVVWPHAFLFLLALTLLTLLWRIQLWLIWGKNSDNKWVEKRTTNRPERER